MDYNNNASNDNPTVGEKEKAVICKLMKHYGLAVTDVISVENAWKVQTENGSFCLKRLKHSKHKAKITGQIAFDLWQNGFANIPRQVKTPGGKYYVSYKNTFYYLVEWIDGEECNADNMEEAISCCKLLAEFHNAAKGLHADKYRIQSNFKNWPKIYSSYMEDLEKFKTVIDKKKNKNNFDLCYEKHMDDFYNVGMTALHYLNTSCYYRVLKEAKEQNTICHENFCHQSMIRAGDSYYLTGVDGLVLDIQALDLAKFIRRLMYKQEYMWDFQKAMKMMEAYDSVRKLKKEELEIIFAIIIFPHKFWKLGNRTYARKKSWDESKQVLKLDKLVNCYESQQVFIKECLEFLDNFNR